MVSCNLVTLSFVLKHPKCINCIKTIVLKPVFCAKIVNLMSVLFTQLMRLKTTLEAKMCTLKLCVMYVHETFTCIPWMKQHRVADRHVVGKYSTQNSVRSICLKCSFALLLLRYTIIHAKLSQNFGRLSIVWSQQPYFHVLKVWAWLGQWLAYNLFLTILTQL